MNHNPCKEVPLGYYYDTSGENAMTTETLALSIENMILATLPPAANFSDVTSRILNIGSSRWRLIDYWDEQAWGVLTQDELERQIDDYHLPGHDEVIAVPVASHKRIYILALN